MMVAGIVLAAGDRLLIIAARWDSFGESSQRVADDSAGSRARAGCLVAGCRVSAWSG
jgi:hypothetical protein